MSDPFKMSSPLPQSSNNKKQNSQASSFLEALREQGKAATSGVASSAFDQLRGSETNPTPTQEAGNPIDTVPFNFAEFLKMREARIRQQEREMANQQHRTETIIFHQKEERAKQEIEVIKAEIKKIIESTAEVSAELYEAEQSVMANTVEVGTYQINFFERIRQLLIVVRKRLSESQHWLEQFNTRSAKKSYYWGQVKKSGTKYMLSQERYMATQAG